MPSFQQRARVSWLPRTGRFETRLALGYKFLETAAQVDTARGYDNLSGTSPWNTGHTALGLPAIVHAIEPSRSTAYFRLRQPLPTADLGHGINAFTSVENRRLENLAEEAATLPSAVTLQQSVIFTAEYCGADGGRLIAQSMHRPRAPNTWRSNEILRKNIILFCSWNCIDPLSGNESIFIRYLGWLHIEGSISATSVRNYLSAVTAAHSRVGRSMMLTPLFQLAIDAYQQSNRDQNLATHPAGTVKRTALPSSVARKIFAAAIFATDSDLEFLRNTSAALVSCIFFERGETGVLLQLRNILVARDSIKIAIALRKNQRRKAHTLSYTHNSIFDSNGIDLVQRYDTIRLNIRSGSKYYWALTGTRFSTTARTMKLWLKFCLTHIQVSPPPQVPWTSHSLGMGAATEFSANGAQ